MCFLEANKSYGLKSLHRVSGRKKKLNLIVEIKRQIVWKLLVFSDFLKVVFKIDFKKKCLLSLKKLIFIKLN